MTWTRSSASRHRFVSGVDDESIAYAAESLRLLRAEIDAPHRAAQGAGPGAVPGQAGHPRDRAPSGSLKLWPLACIIDEAQNLFGHPKYGKSRRAGRRVHHQDRPGVRRVPDPGHPAARQGEPADRCLRQRVHPVLPQGHRPGRERHDPGHLGVQERAAGDHVPAEDRRRARLPGGRRARRRRWSARST